MTHRSLLEDPSPALSMEDAYRVIEALGPMPAEGLAAMVDYGLSDDEIGRYYNLPHELITTLKDYWRIDGGS